MRVFGVVVGAVVPLALLGCVGSEREADEQDGAMEEEPSDPGIPERVGIAEEHVRASGSNVGYGVRESSSPSDATAVTPSGGNTSSAAAESTPNASYDDMGGVCGEGAGDEGGVCGEGGE